MKLVVFDIDGTLIQSHPQEVACFEAAIQSVLGIADINRDVQSYQHVTDSGILKECVSNALGRFPTDIEIAAVETEYLAAFSNIIMDDPIQPIAGVHSFIEMLQTMPDVVLAIATGSHYRSALLKLSHVHPSLCDIPMGTSSDSDIRTTIMEIALKKAKETYTRSHFNQIIYIGDGPWDVKAVKHLQWGFIGIASNYAMSQLQEWGAKCVIDNYLAQTDFLQFMQHEQPHLLIA
jgi:phosphoglycolate phosphatase-like HAD superfamily hydrolase